MCANELHKDIESTEEELHTILNAERRLKIIKNEINIVEHDIRVQGKKMKDELTDVSHLEKTSVASLFQKILGNQEEQLEKERQEYLQEVLSYNSLIDEYEVLKYEQEILLAKVDKKLETQSQYKFLLLEKEKIIKLSYPTIAVQLKKIDNLIKFKFQVIKEIDEAIDSGRVLQQLLHEIVSNLNYVKQWGQIRFYGKKNHMSYEKKGYIDKAQKLIGKVQVKINIFEKELTDLYPDFDLDIDNLHLKDFVHSFYNGLIIDWIVEKKLVFALRGTVSAIQKVDNIISMLDLEKEKQEKSLLKITEEKKQLIIGVDLEK